MPEGEDIVQHLTNAIESDLAERMNEIPGDVYEEFHKLPMEKIEVSEKQLSPKNARLSWKKLFYYWSAWTMTAKLRRNSGR